MTTTRSRPTALHLDLAHRILQHARWSDLEAGAHLREAELAERFHVSRSPIRAALRLLSERGLVAHSPNQGVFLRFAGRKLDPDILGGVPATQDELYRQLVRDRLAGALPDTLSLTDLTRRYAVSRTRVTRLLTDMSDEGLIERLPGQRWRFSHSLTSEELYDSSYRFRLVIEPAALLEPGFSANEAELAELVTVHERLIAGEVWSCSYSYLYQADATFHECIARWSGNTFVAQAVRGQNRLRRLTEYQYYEDRTRVIESCREHAAVLDAVRASHAERAAELMRHHIDTSWQFRPSFPPPGQAGGGNHSE